MGFFDKINYSMIWIYLEYVKWHRVRVWKQKQTLTEMKK